MTSMRTRTYFSLLAFFPIAACVGSAGHAQQMSAAPAPASTAKTSAYTVSLPVTVRDKKGDLVTSLNKSDLALTEDGKPQTIQGLTRDDSQPVRIGLLVDTTRRVAGATDAERKAAGGFVDQVLPASGESKNQVFLIHFDREVELLQDFTGSRDQVHQELDNMGPTQQSRRDEEGPETTDNPNESRPQRRDGDQLYDAIYLAADELMKGKTGRKALIIFSDGADHGSKETMNDAVDAADRAGLTVYTIFFKGEQERSGYGRDSFPGGGHRGSGYPGGGGSGWPGSGGGRRQPEPTSGTGIDGKKIMQEIAARTGGHAYEAKKTTDLEPIYKLIDQDLKSQYSLTYTPDKPDTEGGFHKTAITANNKDWSVATREGYYAPEGKQ